MVKIAVVSRADRLWKSIRGCAGVLSALTRNPGSRFFVSEWAVIRAEHSKWAENIGKRWGTRQGLFPTRPFNRPIMMPARL